MADDSTAVEPAGSFDEAVFAALSEMGEATPVVEAQSQPDDPNDLLPDDDDAEETEAATNDQVDEADADEDFFADDAKQSPSKGKPRTYNVPGIGDVPDEELVKGYLRQADYTRKTQELAAQQRELEQRANADTTGNAELWAALKEDPQGTVAYLATQVGLISEEDAADRVRKLANVKLRPESDVEAMVQERLAAALVNHPVMQEALHLKVQTHINNEFRAIESRIGRSLSERDRTKVMDFAAANQLNSLDVAFDALAARSGQAFQTAPQKQKATSQKRTPASTGRPKPISDEPVKDFSEAAQRAFAELEALNEV